MGGGGTRVPPTGKTGGGAWSPPPVPTPMNFLKHLTDWLGVSTVELCGQKKRHLAGSRDSVSPKVGAGTETPFCMPPNSPSSHGGAPPGYACTIGAQVSQLFQVPPPPPAGKSCIRPWPQELVVIRRWFYYYMDYGKVRASVNPGKVVYASCEISAAVDQRVWCIGQKRTLTDSPRPVLYSGF